MAAPLKRFTQHGRTGAAAAGAGMLLAVFLLDEPGISRVLCSAFAGLFLLLAVWPRRAPEYNVTDFIDLECTVIEMQARAEARERQVSARVDRITGMVEDIAAGYGR